VLLSSQQISSYLKKKLFNFDFKVSSYINNDHVGDLTDAPKISPPFMGFLNKAKQMKESPRVPLINANYSLVGNIFPCSGAIYREHAANK